MYLLKFNKCNQIHVIYNSLDIRIFVLGFIFTTLPFSILASVVGLILRTVASFF